MNNKKIFFLFFIALVLFVLPSFVSAGEYQARTGEIVSYPGLVPCGSDSCV